jgi:hypothetical protein
MPPYVGREGRRCDDARSIRSPSIERRPDASREPLKEVAMRTIDLIGCALLGVSLTSIACDINDLAQPHAAPVLTATERIVDYRLIDGRFFAFMAANCRDLDVKLASSRRETVMKGIEACWNRFNPEI